MNKREKRRTKREIAAIARLKDSDIDTTVVPEITDWSGAIIGKFYRPELTSASQLAATESKSEAPEGNVGNVKIDWGPNTSPADIVYEQLTPGQLLAECFKGAAGGWNEFARRSHQLIGAVAQRTARTWGETRTSVVEDLVQETYIKLFAHQCAELKKFTSTDPNAFAGFLKVFTANVVYEHFRHSRLMHKLALESAADSSVRPANRVADLNTGTAEQNDTNILLAEIDEVLLATVSERDRTIFWLYYRHGCTSGQIAAIPTIGLTVRGVESVIFRVTKLLKQRLSLDVENRQFENH